MASFAPISTSSGSKTSLFSDSANPIKVFWIQSDPASDGVAHVFVTSEVGVAEDEITVFQGAALPISRSGGITGVVAYADGGKTVNLYTAILAR